MVVSLDSEVPVDGRREGMISGYLVEIIRWPRGMTIWDTPLRGPWVSLGILLADVVAGQVGIDLGGGDVGVAQHLLHITQGGAALSMWVAKLCRRMCGVVCDRIPASRA